MKIDAYPEFCASWTRFNQMEAEIGRKKVELDDFAFDDWLQAEDPGIYKFMGRLSTIAWKAPAPEDYVERRVAAVRCYDHPEAGRIYRVFCSRPVEGAVDIGCQLLFGEKRYESGNVMGLLDAYTTCRRCDGSGVPLWGAKKHGEACDCPGARGLDPWDRTGNVPFPLGVRRDEFLFGRDALDAVDW